MITVASQVQLKAEGSACGPSSLASHSRHSRATLGCLHLRPRAPHKDLFVVLRNCREKLWSDLGAPGVLLAVANEGTALVQTPPQFGGG